MADLKNSKILVIVESPYKVAHIKEYLVKAGYKNVVVMASVGHIMELANDKKSYYNTGVDVDNGFAMNIQIADGKHDVVNKIKAQAAIADKIFLMSDPDREGFVIAWSIMTLLNLPKSKCLRAITHEITPKAVIRAIENPVDMDGNFVDAGLARLALDKMVGYRLSPIAKTYIGAKSVGRCQSVGLKLVCDREKEISEFIPEKYIDLYLHFKKGKTDFTAKYVGIAEKPVDHLKTDKEVNAIKKACVDDFKIESIDTREKQESPKPPFSTATYQQEAASKLNLKVKDAASIAQKLFEAGKITYIRTDDTTFAPEFMPVLKSYITSTFGEKNYVAPRVGKKQAGAQEGHECLRVTDPSFTPEEFAEKSGNALQAKVYKMIWQRTIAAALPNAIISETTYTISNNGHKFTFVSNEVIDPGYRSVYSYKDDDAEENGPVKETFKKGEVLKNTELEDIAKETKPKPRYTEATLLKELEKRGIGRPSTYATIVETVLSETRGYAKLDGKSIVPTERGVQLAAFLDRSFPNFINFDYTKQMEEGLDKIANAKMTKREFLTEFYNSLEKAIKDNKEIGGQETEAPICPNCGAPMVVRRSRYGKLFYGCSNYPKCTGIVSIK